MRQGSNLFNHRETTYIPSLHTSLKNTMPSVRDCCVPGCTDSGGIQKILHTFPNPEKDRERFNTWLYAIGGDVLALDNWHIYKYRRVCRRHFEEKYLCRYNKISCLAVPRLNMPGQFSKKTDLHSGRWQLQQIENIANPSTSSQPLTSSVLYSDGNQQPNTLMNIVPEAGQKENIFDSILNRYRLMPKKYNFYRVSVPRTDILWGCRATALNVCIRSHTFIHYPLPKTHGI